MVREFDAIIMIHIVTCGSPSPLSNGYIFNYSGTLEGATVLFLCNNSYPADENYKTAACNHLGKWEPNPNVVCKITSNSGCTSVCFYKLSVAYQTPCFVQEIIMQDLTTIV